MKQPAPHAAKRSALNPGPGKDYPAPVNNESFELLAKVRNLPFDRLRVNGLRLKLFSFSVRGETFDSPFALRFSKGERFAQDKLVEPQKNTFARGSFGTTKSEGASGFFS